MRQMDLPLERIRVANNTRAAARQGVRDYLHQHEPPDGLFCYNDGLAVGAYRAIRDLGLRVPEDVMLVGCDGIEETLYLDCPLSTLVLPTEEMCDAAWQFLERRMSDPALPPQKTTVYPCLEIRNAEIRNAEIRNAEIRNGEKR